jgi:hypothetical protein
MFETIDIDKVLIEDLEEQKLFNKMVEEAKDWILKKAWCKKVNSIQYGFGIIGIILAFLCEIVPDNKNVDKLLWIIVGDIPYAYLVTDNTKNGKDAVSIYCDLMDEWVEAVKTNKTIDELIPVNVPPTVEWANNLGTRIRFIRDNILK